MSRRMFVRALRCVACVLPWCYASVGQGQVPPSSPLTELRRQVEALQRQIETLEGGGTGGKSATRERVTELGASRHARGEPELVLRIYDLSDLFVQAPPYPAVRASELGQNLPTVFPGATDQGTGTGGGGFGGGGGGFFNIPALPGNLEPRGDGVLRQFAGTQQSGGNTGGRTSMDQLVETITSTISPESWDEVGGSGSIALLGTSLVISTDRNNHQQIDDLIDQLRGRWRTLRTISVRAWWLWLSDEQLAAVVPPVAAPAADGSARKSTPGGPVHGLVDPTAWRELLDQVAAGDPESAGYRAAVTGYNGQMVHTVTSDESLTISDVEAVLINEDDAERVTRHVAYQPLVRVLNQGAALQVLPTATSGGNYVILDLHSQVSRIRERGLAAPAVPAEGERRGRGDLPPQQVTAAIDRPQVATQRISTTLRLPIDRAMLAGGMTFDSATGPSTLYLFVQAGVQELRDDLPTGGQDVDGQHDADGQPEAEQQPADVDEIPGDESDNEPTLRE